ncbi:flagellar hook-associated protein FlgK [Kineococcus sp. R8]|uniref:flagellar hook-associated protein FlgK n=1 Tax=Kineococcus siccus TaxID=2696567 RepID=UPI001411F309|nr:flagellar hook-associated protein FlgK [Kineococcus siccus]NAZ83881.1 flagellar hook-associated protein FlgK [Kineococcus siccus]
MSTFSGINLASRGLSAAQRGMEVTGQNIANANTPGYTRQRLDQTEATAATDGLWSSRKDVPGDGVEITGITRIADAFVDARKRQDAATAAEQRTASAVLTQVDTGLGEPGKGSLTQRLTDLYKSWGDLGTASGEDAAGPARTTVMARSAAVSDTLKSLDTSLQQQWGNLRDNTSILADDINGTAAHVAELNLAVRKAVNAGTSPNELMDQRDVYVNHLTDLTGARVTPGKDGTVDVYLGNAVLVSGVHAEKVTVAASAGTPATSVEPRYLSLDQVKGDGGKVFLKVGTLAVAPDSGTLKATLDAVNTALPTIAKQYDAAAASIAKSVNDIYNPDLPHDPAKDFYRVPATAASLTTVPTKGTDLAGRDSAPGTVDRSVAKALGQLPETAASPSRVWRDTVTSIASTAQAAESRAVLAGQVALKSDAAREAVSGVNMDEEMTNLVTFQHAYSASARVLSAINESLDTLINLVR